MLYHHLFSSQAAGFLSEPAETQAALASVQAALAAHPGEVTHLVDRGFDDDEVWEDVQLMGLADVQTLSALGWVAAAFLYELGVGLDGPAVRLLVRLAGGELRANRPPGKAVLTRGLRRLLDHFVTDAFLRRERGRGPLPPQIAAFLHDYAQPP